eukprot:c4436_g1_i1.p1 GENE.c4436_g1_i1~~c4436_g1_i1.p1  ORF type:complete len:487 (-),score=80.93 c4436_g1_i1:59-1519(-)
MLLLVLCLALPQTSDDTQPCLGASCKNIDAEYILTTSGRPDPKDRKFVSPYIDNLIDSIVPKLASTNLSIIFNQSFPNALDTTIYFDDQNNDTFVITGDITAMWLRDSTNQLLPYVQFIKQDLRLGQMICGAIRRQLRNVLVDRYANAFNKDCSGQGWQTDSRSTIPPVSWCNKGNVFEGKYELDSLLHTIKLSYAYFNITHDATCFASDGLWESAMSVILQTIQTQQQGSLEELSNPAYTFQRTDSVATNTLINHGRGVPALRCGLSKSYFRPSDDSTSLPFHIPSNAMAVVELAHLSEIALSLKNTNLSASALQLRQEISDALEQFGVVMNKGRQVYAYEVDGYGSFYLMDDANIPSLLSLPYLGFTSKQDPLYLKTRSLLLSNANPYFFSGSQGEGIGGPHNGLGWIWPMSIIMRALTSDDDNEIAECLALLAKTHADTFFIHESYWKDDSMQYTRSWFSWANSLFGELILTLARERPYLIFK